MSALCMTVADIALIVAATLKLREMFGEETNEDFEEWRGWR